MNPKIKKIISFLLNYETHYNHIYFLNLIISSSLLLLYVMLHNPSEIEIIMVINALLQVHIGITQKNCTHNF